MEIPKLATHASKNNYTITGNSLLDIVKHDQTFLSPERDALRFKNSASVLYSRESIDSHRRKIRPAASLTGRLFTSFSTNREGIRPVSVFRRRLIQREPFRFPWVEKTDLVARTLTWPSLPSCLSLYPPRRILATYPG